MKKILMSGLIFAVLTSTTTSCNYNDEEDKIVKPDIYNNHKPEPTPANPNKTNKNFVHRVLIEKATGLKCPNCPSMTRAIKRLKYTNIGKHIYSVSMFSFIPDALTTDASKNITKKYYKCREYPSAFINRRLGAKKIDVKTITPYIKQYSPIGIKIKSTAQSTSGNANIDITFQFNQAYTELQYSVYILENNIKAYQAGSGNEIHNNVLRAAKLNEKIGSVSKGQQVTKSTSLSYTMTDKGTSNTSSLDILVYVMDDKGHCMQVQKAKANTTKDFDFK